MKTKSKKKLREEIEARKSKALDIFRNNSDEEKIDELLVEFGISPSEALTAAAYHGSCNMCEKLINSGADINETDIFGVVPLQVSAAYGYNDKVELFIKHGAILNPKVSVDGLKTLGSICSPLLVAAQYNKVETVKILLGHGCDPNKAANVGDSSPLRAAVKGGHEALVDVLLEHGMDWKWPKNRVCIPLSASMGNLSILRKLVENSKIAVTDLKKFKNSDGIQSPLEEAVIAGSEECVLYLLSKGASPNQSSCNFRRNSSFTSCIFLALFNGHIHLMDILIKNGGKFRADSKGLEPYQVNWMNTVNEDDLVKLVSQSKNEAAVDYAKNNANFILNL